MERTNTKADLLVVEEIQLVYKSKIKASERPQITNSEDAYHLLCKCWDEGKIEFIEEFKVLLLNRANKVLSLFEVSTGGVTGTVADPRVILVAALKRNAVAMILSHNHPSGNLKPSRADEELTTKIKNAAAFHDMKILDHLIVSPEGYYSFADEGLL